MIQDSFIAQYSTLVCLLLLVYASWLDQKHGFVPNKFWLTAFSVACFSSGSSCVSTGVARILADVLFSLAFALPISLALFRLKIFGGSDAKALLMLSIFIPTLTPLCHSSVAPLLTPLSVTINLLVLLGAIFAINTIRNVAICLAKEKSLPLTDTTRTKLMLLCAYKRLNLLKPHHERVLQFTQSDSRTPAYIVVTKKGDCTISTRSNDSKRSNLLHNPRIAELWLKLRIPLIPVVTLSLLVSLALGDVLSPPAI